MPSYLKQIDLRAPGRGESADFECGSHEASLLMLAFLQIGNALSLARWSGLYEFRRFWPGTSAGTGVFDGTGYKIQEDMIMTKESLLAILGLPQAMILLELMIWM